MLCFNKPNDYANPRYIGSIFRRKRFQFFADRIRHLKEKPLRILDLGGKVDFWVNQNYQNRYGVMITILNTEAEVSNYFNIRTIQGDACDLSMFETDQFDVAFSNSLIEHLSTPVNQLLMALEAMRVGRYHFIQTPNLYFPIEPHFKFPFFQFLPKSIKLFLMTQTSLINNVKYERSFAENMIEEINLLSQKDFQQFFPESALYIEKFMGLVKSFVAHNLPDPATELSLTSQEEQVQKKTG